MTGCQRRVGTWVVGFLFGAIIAAPVTGAAAAPNGSTWEALPPETAMALRVPDGQAVLSALRQNTKLGTVLLQPARIEKIAHVFRAWQGKSWDKVSSKLGDYGLAPEDLPQLFRGESGFALVIDQPEGEQALLCGLAWLEPGQTLAQRAWEAIGKAVEDQESDRIAIKRVDIDLDGHAVMQLTVPIVRRVFDGTGFSLPDNFSELSDDEQRAALAEARRQAKKHVREKVRHTCVMVTRLAGRLVVANMFRTTQEPDVPEQQVDRLAGILARFLAAHSGKSAGFVAAVTSSAGAQSVLVQQGLPVLEMFANVAPAIRLAGKAGGEKTAAILDGLGLNQLGAVLLRTTLDGTHLRTSLFVAAPTPREGLLKLLDQPEIAAEPPAWVPMDVVEYGQISADLGKIYTQVKELIRTVVGVKADSGFQMLEAQVQSVAKADLATVLRSLGHCHMLVTYAPGPKDNDTKGKDAAKSNRRMAFVWQVEDEDIWSRILQSAAALGPLTHGALKPTDEQGFHGWRYRREGTEGAVVLGKGFLVGAIGQGALERTLASLNDPPDDDRALRTSSTYDTAQKMIHLAPGVSFQVTDGNRYVKTVRRSIVATLKQLSQLEAAVGAAGGTEPAARLSARDIQEILPSESELEGVLGVAAGCTVINDHGLLSESANELPPPD